MTDNLIFDRAFISAQHKRRSPIPEKYRFLFDKTEEDALARLDFLKDKAQTTAIHGRRFFTKPEAHFREFMRFKLSTNELWQDIENNNDLEKCDAIISLFSLHGVNNAPNVLKLFRERLTNKGMFVGCVFGPQTLSTLRQALATAEQDVRGETAPRIYPFAEASAWVGLLQNAGYALPVADSEIVTVHYKSLKGLLTDLRMMGEANGMINRSRKSLTPNIIKRAEEIYKNLTNDPDGLLPAHYEIVWLQGFRS